ncbi:MAG: alpha-amylase family glycosyl hydrolase [Bradyrhizobium sp.]
MSVQQADLLHAPMGGTLVPDGATFRVWAPRAHAVHVSGDFNGWKHDVTSRMAPIGGGHWASFVPVLKDGDQYLFYVEGIGSSGYKRDPRARLLGFQPAFPACSSVLRNTGRFPWHHAQFVPPDFNDLILYQLHVGTYAIAPGNPDGKFFDVIARVPHLAALGVNAIELLPIQEFPTAFSMGYNGTDLYSPENQYAENDEARLQRCFDLTNAVLQNAGQTPYGAVDVLRGADNQLRALVDVCHLHGIAVIFDVVYNHAGGGFDDQSMWFFDRLSQGDNNDSLYFTDQGWAGGLVFAYWNNDVKQYLIDNAKFLYEEYRIDGLRFDEVSVMDHFGGWTTCQDLTSTLRAAKPEAIQIAEYWPVSDWIVRDRENGGAGFDATWNDSLRDSVRAAVSSASRGATADVPMSAIANAIANVGLRDNWRAVQSIENHDIVYAGRDLRIARLADGNDPRSWYARSRSRVAMGLVLTSPGIPMLFMGQEVLADKPWSDTPTAETSIDWAPLEAGDKAITDFLRFARELIGVRRTYPALRAEGCAIIHVQDQNRVLAFQRWVEGEDRDVVVVCSLNETTLHNYEVGFPAAGRWREVFNSDVYDNLVNPLVAGNGGGVNADGPALHGLPASAALTIPANSLLVFATS